jgi:hypothetical protein
LALPPACPSGVLKMRVEVPFACVAVGNDAFAVPVPVAWAIVTPAHVLPGAMVNSRRRTDDPLNCTANRVLTMHP